METVALLPVLAGYAQAAGRDWSAIVVKDPVVDHDPSPTELEALTRQ